MVFPPGPKNSSQLIYKHLNGFLLMALPPQICSMRDEEKSLRQKLLDFEKAKKQFKEDLATIQHLRTDSRPDDSVQLYQCNCVCARVCHVCRLTGS